MYMAKIHEVHTTDSGPSFDAEPLENVHSNDDYNVFANERQYFVQPVSINNTCVVEKVDSNVIPDSSDMCDNDNQADQNAEECDDERVVLANLIANLKLDTDENKKIQKQLKKANTSLAHELQEFKSALEECKSSLEESNRTRDRCIIKLQNKEIELEKYNTYHDLKATLKERIFHGVNEKTSLQALRTQFKEFLASKRGNEGSSESRLATQTSKDFNTLGVFRMKENELSMRLKENEPENTMHSNKSETETADGKGKRKRSICDEAVDTDIGPVNDEEHLLEDKKVSPNKSSAVHEKATTLLDLVLGGSTVPTVVDKYLGTQLDDALLKILERHTADLIEKYSVLPGPESIKNQESEKSPKEIIIIKREQGKEKQDFNYSIRPQGKLIVDDDKVDDDDEGPSAGSTGRSGKEKKDPIMPLLALTSPGWAVTDTRDDVNSAMPSI
ncbi:hypothetical protein Tco_1406673 [Tanacetum coccineum]